MRGVVQSKDGVEFRYDVYGKIDHKWGLVASCLTEDDARAVADRRADIGQPTKVEDGDKLLYKRA